MQQYKALPADLPRLRELAQALGVSLADLAQALGLDVSIVATKAAPPALTDELIAFKGASMSSLDPMAAQQLAAMTDDDFLGAIDGFTEALEDLMRVDRDAAKRVLSAAIAAMQTEIDGVKVAQKAQQVAHLSPADAVARMMGMG